MVNSYNSRSPILLDTPERANGAGGNTTVIEIPDSGERSHARRRRVESIDDVIMADSPKRARVDVPVIDLTTDNEEESSSADNNSDSLLITLENSPVYAELMRGHYFGGADHNRYRLRRALSLRHRPTSHHLRHQIEGRQNNLGSLATRNDSGRNNNGLSNTRLDNFESTILVEDDESPTSQPSVIDRASGFSRPSCSRVSPPRLSTVDYTRPTSPSARSERSRPPVLSNLLAQESHENDNERRSSRRDTTQHLRAVRRNNRRLRELQSRQLRGHFDLSSPFTNFAGTSHDNPGRASQPSLANQETGVHSAVYSRPNANVETNRLNLRVSPPMERGYDFPDLMLPALLSWWGPDSRLRHFGNVEDEREDYEALWSLTERLGQVKPKGLSKAEMEEIPAFRYSAASKDSSNGSCVVCMMNYSNKEKLRRLPCNHDFHAKCIDKWLKNNRSCPVCRKDVTTK